MHIMNGESTRSHLVFMKKKLSWCLALMFAAGAAQAQTAGFLRAKDARIVDGQGREIILRGMGLGGWMLQEGYMLGINKEGTQHSIKSRITDLIGKEDCDKFYRPLFGARAGERPEHLAHHGVHPD